MRNAPRRNKLKYRELTGRANARGRRFGIVVSRFNEFYTERLLEGAVDTLRRHGARARDLWVVRVPGAFEIPLALSRLLRAKRLDAAIALAVVIRGETKHFDQVVRESARGVREAAEKHDCPVILGILTAENTAQVIDRLGVKHLHKGREWAEAAIEMATLPLARRAKGRVS